MVKIDKIFILCQHRSGSTLLQNILNSHSKIEMAVDELNIYEPFRKNTLDKLIKKDSSINALIENIDNHNIYGSYWEKIKKLNKIGDIVNNLNNIKSLTPESVIRSIIDGLKEKKNVLISGVKYPVHILKINRLISEFPDSLIIYLTRNPYAIVASKLNDKATKRRKNKLGLFSFVLHYFTILYFSIEYNLAVKTYYKYRNFIMLITYEDLVLYRHETVNNICNKCLINIESDMLNVTGKETSYSNNEDMFNMKRYNKALRVFDKLLIKLITRKQHSRLKNEYFINF